MRALVGAGTDVVTVVGKSWDLHAREVLGVSLDENLRMIADSVAYLAANVKEVVYDAEHFFDGYKKNPDYALKTLKAAAESGAQCLVLCDTNGGSLPDEIADAIEAVNARSPPPSASTSTTTATWPSPIPWPRSTTAPPRCRARSTASASAAATPTCAA